jgi:hypothetical protein
MLKSKEKKFFKGILDFTVSRNFCLPMQEGKESVDSPGDLLFHQPIPFK